MDSTEVNVTISVGEMKAKAATSRVNPLQLYAEGILQLDYNARARLPSEDTVKRTLRNQRSNKYQKCPTSLDELIIEGEFCTIGEPDGHRFLLHDTGTDSDERIIIFSTDACLQRLTEVDTWYMDGNFASAFPTAIRY
ncbi:unnamed protein product [Macrosiphum euphorbiae]|nr:unnamed protein product [Macrosiphum euphorbiae]